MSGLIEAIDISVSTQRKLPIGFRQVSWLAGSEAFQLQRRFGLPRHESSGLMKQLPTYSGGTAPDSHRSSLLAPLRASKAILGTTSLNVHEAPLHCQMENCLFDHSEMRVLLSAPLRPREA